MILTEISSSILNLPAVKIIRLDEITDADVDDLEEQLFQKYSEVEDIRDDMDVE